MSWMERLTLASLDSEPGAQVAIASVPLPKESHAVPVFAGMVSQAVPIAWHPLQDGKRLAKQALVMGIGATGETASLVQANASNVVEVDRPMASASSGADRRGPGWRSAVVEEKKLGLSMREVNELNLSFGGRSVGLRMGVELAEGGHHWWQWMQVEQLWTGPICTAVRAAGYIAIKEVSEDEMFEPSRYNRGDWLHRHNWLVGEVYALIFTNGFMRVTARHVNNRVFDQGRDLEGFVPVIGFTSGGKADAQAAKIDGNRRDFSLGAGNDAVHLDVARTFGMVSAEHPGSLRKLDGMTIYQPYEGTEFLLGDGEPANRWNVRAEEKRMWKGMARSVGFDLSFADAPIRARRYLPPWAWQAQAGALWPDSVLPARGILEKNCDAAITLEPFAALDTPPVHCAMPFCSGRYFEPSSMWDGEHAHGLMRQAYRTSRRDLYDAAIHHAFAYADVGMDHADFTHQIVGMPKGSISLVLQRNIGMLAAYLETGDPYLLRCAESMADVAYAIDRSNWPRRSYGRDGAYIRSMTRLYDVTGESHYLRRAGEACRRATQCQHADGSFADQGGATGVHGHLNEIIKPWMNSILLEVFVDYLERVGSDEVIESAVKRTSDWLLSQLISDADGVFWPYQIHWGQNEFDPTTRFAKDPKPARHPVGENQLDYNARTLLWLSRKTGDVRYVKAWQATYDRHFVKKKSIKSSYGAVKIPDNFPWHEAHLWGARLAGGKVQFDPLLSAIDIGREAVIELPEGGQVRVVRTNRGVEVK